MVAACFVQLDTLSLCVAALWLCLPTAGCGIVSHLNEVQQRDVLALLCAAAAAGSVRQNDCIYLR